MFIDIHVHTRKIPGPERNGRQAYATPEQLLARYDQLRIEKGVLLPGVNPECAYVPHSNEEVIAVSRDTGRFIPFCNVDPRAMKNSAEAPLNELLRHYKKQGCKGVGEVCANLPFTDPLVRNLFTHVQETNLPLTFHMAHQLGGTYGLYDDPGLPQLERTLQDFPDLVLLGHSQTFWAEMAPLKSPEDRAGYPEHPVDQEGRVPVLMRKHPNLYGDLSAGSGFNALARDRDYAVTFLNEFSDRLLFGTDICAPDTPTPLVDFLLELKEDNLISKGVFNTIAKENAVRLLGI